MYCKTSFNIVNIVTEIVLQPEGAGMENKQLDLRTQTATERNKNKNVKKYISQKILQIAV